MKKTFAKMKPCKISSAEIHNQRLKELPYVRKELTCLNVSEVKQEITDRLQDIKRLYTQETGQRMQKTARPIQEIVLGIDENTSLEQVKRFGQLCQERLGMTPIQYYIHRDEGHCDVTTGEWMPNLHAHIIVDTTCYDPNKKVWRTKKSNGTNLKDPVTGKLIKIEVSAYGKTIKFDKSDMRLMQDLAAEATGLERGTASDIKGLDIIEYKMQQKQKDLNRLEAVKEEKLQAAVKAISSAKEIAAKPVRELVKKCYRPILRIENTARQIGLESQYREALFQGKAFLYSGTLNDVETKEPVQVEKTRIGIGLNELSKLDLCINYRSALRFFRERRNKMMNMPSKNRGLKL